MGLHTNELYWMFCGIFLIIDGGVCVFVLASGHGVNMTPGNDPRTRCVTSPSHAFLCATHTQNSLVVVVVDDDVVVVAD